MVVLLVLDDGLAGGAGAHDARPFAARQGAAQRCGAVIGQRRCDALIAAGVVVGRGLSGAQGSRSAQDRLMP
ncbi:hypothetical protein RZO07_12675 [Pseudomonas protegens]|uniref:hypothetical protein n=1 Tax=Pseudomonas protegens TaxID=380021 RepID=UPI002936E472|nr:hypothetical protein [Pseudomonas protegens]WOE82026.1 hypothetical protein RZO07_12675 [Pseudomonas protegens]